MNSEGHPDDIENSSTNTTTSLGYDTELSQIAHQITEIINCLNTLIISTQNPAPHDRLMMSTEPENPMNDQDMADVRILFPRADGFGLEKAARILARLRQYYLYLKDHPFHFEPSKIRDRNLEDVWTVALSMLGHTEMFTSLSITNLIIIDGTGVLNPMTIRDKMQRERSFLPSQESLRTTASPTQGYGHIESQNVPDETDGKPDRDSLPHLFRVKNLLAKIMPRNQHRMSSLSTVTEDQAWEGV